MPFFWTRSFNKSLHYTGNGRGYDRVHIDGNLAEMKFLAYYLKDEKVLAVAGMQRSPDIMVLNEAMRLSQMPKASEIESGAETTVAVLAPTTAAPRPACPPNRPRRTLRP